MTTNTGRPTLQQKLMRDINEKNASALNTMLDQANKLLASDNLRSISEGRKLLRACENMQKQIGKERDAIEDMNNPAKTPTGTSCLQRMKELDLFNQIEHCYVDWHPDGRDFSRIFRIKKAMGEEVKPRRPPTKEEEGIIEAAKEEYAILEKQEDEKDHEMNIEKYGPDESRWPTSIFEKPREETEGDIEADPRIRKLKARVKRNLNPKKEYQRITFTWQDTPGNHTETTE